MTGIRKTGRQKTIIRAADSLPSVGSSPFDSIVEPPFFKFLLKFSIDIALFDNYNAIMNEITFEWDENKAEINLRKHGISFSEAATVFYDEGALLRDDPDHSEDEERFIILGVSRNANLLVVCQCYRQSETVIRLISARKATKNERRQYFDFNRR